MPSALLPMSGNESLKETAPYLGLHAHKEEHEKGLNQWEGKDCDCRRKEALICPAFILYVQMEFASPTNKEDFIIPYFDTEGCRGSDR